MQLFPLDMEYPTRQEFRKAEALTSVRLPEALDIQEARIAKSEPQGALHLFSPSTYVRSRGKTSDAYGLVAEQGALDAWIVSVSR